MVDFERGNGFRCAALVGKRSKNPSRMYQSYKVILGILHVWEEAGVVVSVSMVLHTCAKKGGVILTITWVLNLKKHSCTATWNHVLVLLQLLLLLCAIRQHDDHLRLVCAHISGGVHSSSLGGTKIFQDCNSINLAL